MTVVIDRLGGMIPNRQYMESNVPAFCQLWRCLFDDIESFPKRQLMSVVNHVFRIRALIDRGVLIYP